MRFIGVAVAVVLSVLVAPRNAAAQAVQRDGYDVVIRNGRVLDGQGNPWILADVAIKGGRFAKIGVIPERGRTEIDAKGKYVSPGWIDMMDQSGSVLQRSGLAENKLQEGVTTAIGGEGGTPVPASRVAEYFSTLEKQGNQHQLRQLLQRDAGASRGAWDVSAKADGGGARPNARHR
jgi:N-acyl-D-aspartate/D-glutamate deacylase